MRSRYKGASGVSCVNRHSAKSIASIAVPLVIPKISRSSPGDLLVGEEREAMLRDEEEPFAFACRASRYLWPTGVRILAFGAGL